MPINARVQARHELAKDLIFILVGGLVAIGLAEIGFFDSIIAVIGRIDLASFIAGVFFTSAFTIAPAAIGLSHLALIAPIQSVAFWGALGAMVGDLIIFFFIRDRFANDIVHSFKPSFVRNVLNSFHFGFMKWLSPVLGALIIASPLPDEFGLTLLGLSKTRVAVLMPISFAMNWVGIYFIVALAHAVA